MKHNVEKGNQMAYGSKNKEYYKLQSVPNTESLKITKFTPELEVESQYFINKMPTADGHYWDCQCPAAKFECRHKKIMKSIQDAKMVDTEKFFCFQTSSFHDMTGI